MQRVFSLPWAMMFLVTVFMMSLVGVGISAADAHNYTLQYPEDEGSQRQLQSEIKSSGIGEGGGGLEKTKLLTKGGRLGNSSFSFDRGYSDEKDTLVYTRDVYCTLKNSEISTSKPGDNELYVQYRMAVAVNPGGTGGSLFNKNEYQTWVGAAESGTKLVHLPSYTYDPPVGSTDERFSVNGSNHDVAIDNGDDNGKKPNGDNTDAVYDTVRIKNNFDINNGQEYALYKHMPSLFSDWTESKTNYAMEHPGDDDYNYNDSIREELQRLVDRCLPSPKEGNLTSNYAKLSEEDKASWADAAAESTSASGGDDDGGEVGTNCSGGPMGWLFCPMIEAMAKVVQESAKLIDKLMTVRFLTTDDSANTIETAWRAILSVANLLLVVAFLIIIFSQATNAGLSNYNIKRMLPRLVIAAILMNLSFYICALAIDFSNIVGASIMGFLLGGGNSISSAITEVTGGDGGADFLSIGGIATGLAMIALLFFIFVPLVLAIVTVFIALVARQVILMCLVLISPIAFVAWLLPNTEQYFKKWSDMFIQLLVLYPVVMFIFGVSLYVSKLLGNDVNIIGGDN